jgi:hypothetical protein
MRLAEAFPNDLWGSKARELARLEAAPVDGAAALALERAANSSKKGRLHRCSVCRTYQSKRREWCIDCGEDL